MNFTINDTSSYEETRYNDVMCCYEYLFEGKWYDEDDLINKLKTLDLITIESAQGFVSIDDLDLHFPVELYVENNDYGNNEEEEEEIFF